MSPSKSKSKSSARAAREQQKTSAKSSTPTANTGNGIPANAYNPVSGTFHLLETAPIAPSPPPHNGRFRNIDETDVHPGIPNGNGVEYDLVSNNESCSGESEDQKEKAAAVNPRPEAIPGADNDKREKIRLKNERKHQRQRERRALELHERCTGYLMSRKLEALAQQLVAMGFPSERATMALILNEGRVEESVVWLLEGGEEGRQPKDPSLRTGGNLKIDITEELACITELETKFKCTKQEVERAVVSSEGDLEKAAELLRVQKPEPVAAPLNLEGTGDPPAISDGSKQAVSDAQSTMRTLTKSVASVSIQQRRDERDFNYTKVAAPVAVPPESVSRNLQSITRIQPKSEWAKSQPAAIPVDKRWLSVSSSPSVSYSLASPLQVSQQPAKTETRYVVSGSEVKNMPTGTVREPVIMMQRSQTINAKQNPSTSLNGTPTTAGWYPSGVAGVDVIKANAGVRHVSSSSLSNSNLNSQQLFHQQQYQPFSSSLVEPAAVGWGGSWSSSGTSSSTSLSVPSSLGLFTGWGISGSLGSSSPVDWSMGGSMPQCDYNNIDWSLESTSSRQSDLWMGITSCMKTSRMYDGWSVSTGAPNGSRLGVNGVCLTGLQEGVVPDSSASSAGSHEWTSPFAGKDLFSQPRQFVTSPSL